MNLFRRNRPPAAKQTPIELVDISSKTFGKYQHCTQYKGVWYADSDFADGPGMGKPKIGAIPDPKEEDRTPFGQRRKTIVVETEAQKRTRWQKEREETHALLESLAGDLVDDVRAEQSEWLEKFTAEYERDIAGYSFDCHRHGEFLTLLITRKGNPLTEHPYSIFSRAPVEQTLATTLNLGNCREIRFMPGHPPDLLGKASFGYSMEQECGTIIGGTGFGNYAASKGSRWVVSKPECRVPHGRPLCVLSPSTENPHSTRHLISDDTYKIRTRVDRTARAAEDDRIFFEGIGATLYAPSSLGEGVHEKILKALE